MSIPRQAGKSLLAAILGIYGLVQHCQAPKVLGVASTTHQAGIVYGYAIDAIYQSKALGNLLIGNTRGIRRRKGLGQYKVLAAKQEKLQGYEATLSIVDELHILKTEIWDSLVESQRAQDNPLLVGITTAGDIQSTLLKRLYTQGDEAIAGQQEAFGFFVYEAVKAELTAEQVTEANPAVAAGRISAQTILDDCKGQVPSQWQRFTLNLFVDGKADPWVSPGDWQHCAGTGLEDFSDAIYAIEIAPKNTYATIYAAKLIDGTVKTHLVKRFAKPTHQDLTEWMTRIRRRGRCTFVVNYRDATLIKFLTERRWDYIKVGSGGTNQEATAMAYQAITNHEVEHDNNAIVTAQHRLGTMKTNADTGMSVLVAKGETIDAAYACVYAIYGALTHKRKGIGIA